MSTGQQMLMVLGSVSKVYSTMVSVQSGENVGWLEGSFGSCTPFPYLVNFEVQGIWQNINNRVLTVYIPSFETGVTPSALYLEIVGVGAWWLSQAEDAPYWETTLGSIVLGNATYQVSVRDMVL